MIKLKSTTQTNQDLSIQVQDFLEDCKIRGLAKDTINTYKSNLNLFSTFAKDKEINTKLINDYVLYMRSIGNSDRTIRTKIKFIRTFLNWSGHEESIKYPIIKIVRDTKVIYTQEEIEALIKAPTRKTYTEIRNHTMICFLLGTGVRLRTLVNVRIEDLDFKNNVINLRITKTKKQYYIPLSSDLKAILKKYLSLYEHEDSDYLFVNQYAEQLSRSTVKEAIRLYNLKRGVTKTSIHLFRHTFAVNYLRKGGNLYTLKNLLGHYDISTTEKYLHYDIEDLQQDFNLFCPLDAIRKKAIKLKK